MRPCLKQTTRCTVVFADEDFTAVNRCDVPVTAGVQVCPRELAGGATGEGYELCGSTHAEANAAEMIPAGKSDGTAYLYGHTWFCGPCQWALVEKGVRHFVVTGDPA